MSNEALPQTASDPRACVLSPLPAGLRQGLVRHSVRLPRFAARDALTGSRKTSLIPMSLGLSRLDDHRRQGFNQLDISRVYRWTMPDLIAAEPHADLLVR